MWNGFTGAVSGLGKAAVIGAKDQYNQYSDIVSTALKGDILGANEKFCEKSLRDAAFVGQAVINHWQEIAVGIAIGAVAVATAPIWIPAVVGVVSTTGLVAIGAAATAVYVGATYGPSLNKVNDTCNWDGSGNGCGQSIKDVQEQAITDVVIVGGSLGVGSMASKPVGAALAKLIPVEGLSSVEAEETYAVALKALKETKPYGNFKRIVVVDSNSDLGGSRAAVSGDTLYINKDTLAWWQAYPNTAVPHEIGHRTIVNGFGEASPKTVKNTLLGSELGGPGIEVAADKNAFLINGQAYAKEWQAFRMETHVNPLLERPHIEFPDAETYAYLYTVYQNTGDTKTAQLIMSTIENSNEPLVTNYFKTLTNNYQRIWDTTTLSNTPNIISGATGLISGSNAKTK
jgi:hypothetical protein